MLNPIVRIHPADNIIVALEDLPPRTTVKIGDISVTTHDFIPKKHKFALTHLQKDDAVTMYGVLVGRAIQSIPVGGLISTENLKHDTAVYGKSKSDYHWTAPDVSQWNSRTFEGYHRSNGSVGTANLWLVLPLVFCENRNIEVLESALLDSLGYATKKSFSVNLEGLIDRYQAGASTQEILESPLARTLEDLTEKRVFPNVDGIKFLRHQGGCGGTRQDSQSLCHLLAGYITHPNVAGATVLSLGCQNAQADDLKEAIALKDPQFSKPLYILEQQNSTSEESFIEQAVKQTFLGLIQANESARKPAPLSKLVLGLECGGSDGFSGISANPVLGYASDLLVALNGITILSEFPELNGVEQELINRCSKPELAQRFSELMMAYSQKAVAVGSGFENNPSPGNIQDGLITDAMKSAGAAKKGGTSPISGVLDYTEKATTSGLNLLCTPGNDVESTTGLAGSGANVIVFTTGLGTPTGNPVTPVIKVSSNNKLFDQMNDIIDFNTGTVISGEDSIESKGNQLLEYIISVASGLEIPAAVRLGQDDFIPWKRGISL